MNKSINRTAFLKGFKDGIPIGLGYFAVAFSLGIAARSAGMSPLQGFLMSILNNASAGEYAAVSVIAAGGAYIEMAIITLVTNARYLLMSCALSQRLSTNTRLPHRLLMGAVVTDEIFAVTISQPGYANPYYTYGAIVIASPLWAVGTAFGIAAGNFLPANIVSAFSVALFGMFIAVLIPQAKKDKKMAIVIIASFLLSWLFAALPAVKEMSEGTRTIILTVGISAVAALIFPVAEDDKNE
ncbi:MAG: AzlC family ABC transporter permease [Clostridia bacterium]|nr:AzlC family ABC transporter permease [Clostridia bacterium]